MAITHLLVHGAWHGSWCWDKVVAELPGHDVCTVDLPSVGNPAVGLSEDARVVRDAVAGIDGPVIVTAHSYGGVVASRALAGLTNVRHIVYLCAFVLDTEDSLQGFVGGAPAPWWIMREDGLIDVKDPVDVLFHDLPDAVAAASVAKLAPQSYRAFTEQQTETAWRTIPTTYLVATEDRAMPVRAQRAMAARCGRKFELTCSHSPFLSHPDYVASLVREVEGTV
ncbi:MAG TPA: alpha/beta hydrolase [Pseudonocardiaceae bacterium]|jgi:pimeloyl-ACP methyl ester carboxylesterase